ncbi:hypothetical protein V1478_013833, partial [Vespula squamosa]
SIFSELSPAPKLSVWRGFKGDVLLRGCAWLKTRSVTSKRRSPSAFPALEFLPRTFFVASDLSYPTKGDGNRDLELGQRVWSWGIIQNYEIKQGAYAFTSAAEISSRVFFNSKAKVTNGSVLETLNLE